MASMANRFIKYCAIFILGLCIGYFLHHIGRIGECNSVRKSPQAQQYTIDNNIIKNGNIEIYYRRYGYPFHKDYFTYENKEYQLLYNDKIIYTILMANKYKVYDIAYEVYKDFVCDRYISWQYIDKEMLRIGIDYLTYGADNSSKPCLLTLSELYDEGILVNNNPVLADSLIKEYEKLF